MGWNTAGVEASRIKSLTYDEPSQTEIGLFETDVGRWSLRSVHARRRDETTYQRLFASDGRASAGDLVTAEAAPLAFFTVWTYEEDGSGNWREIVRIDLQSFGVQVALDRNTFAAAHPGAWNRRSHRVPRRRSVALVQGGVTAGRAHISMGYSLCYVDVETAAIEHVTNLGNGFF